MIMKKKLGLDIYGHVQPILLCDRSSILGTKLSFVRLKLIYS